MGRVGPDDAHLDGCDDGMLDERRVTADELIDALVLFADVDFSDPHAVEARRREWLALA